jgi:D-alanyl-D-alanine carboxypeptidase
MSESSSATETPVRRRDLHRRRSSSPFSSGHTTDHSASAHTASAAAAPTAPAEAPNLTTPYSPESGAPSAAAHAAPSAQNAPAAPAFSPRRAAMAAEARAAAAASAVADNAAEPATVAMPTIPAPAAPAPAPAQAPATSAPAAPSPVPATPAPAPVERTPAEPTPTAPVSTIPSPAPVEDSPAAASTSAANEAPSATPLSPRRAAMAAEARAANPSPRRAAMAKEAARPRSTSAFGNLGASGSRKISAGNAERRGSDGALLKSVRKQKRRTFSALAAVSVAGAATAATVLINNLAGGAEVKTDPTAASEPAAISPESVDAQVSDSKGKSSVEIGAPSAKQKDVEAASRSIKKSALPGCDEKQDFDKSVGNGELPDEWLCDLGKEDHQLRADAAVSFAKMNAAYKKDTGKEMEITDSYRDMAGQLSVAGRKPGLSAKPGTSLHGWGIALDLGGGVEGKSGAWSWLVEHGDEYGWENPDWAKSSKYEPWHWEYKPAREQIKGH